MDKDTFFEEKRLINCGGKFLDLSTPCIMGILNITPDSFFDGGKYTDSGSIVAHCEKMITDGADLIDIGAYSSRPGAKDIVEEEEWRRLSIALGTIRKRFPDIILSVDTFRSEIARRAVEEYNVGMINDISAGMLDAKMFDTIARLKVPYVLMHMQGIPQNMQHTTQYTNLLQEVTEFLGRRTQKLVRMGVNDILIDPGFGFGKTIDQNYQILAHLDNLKIIGFPILVGLSRKSMIYKILNSSPNEALNGTTTLHAIALMKGAGILRVHDVKEASETVKLFMKLRIESENYLNRNH